MLVVGIHAWVVAPAPNGALFEELIESCAENGDTCDELLDLYDAWASAHQRGTLAMDAGTLSLPVLRTPLLQKHVADVPVPPPEVKG